MRIPFTHRILALALGLATLGAAPGADAQRLFRRFMPVQRVDADPQANYDLEQRSGPWLIMAATFSGAGAEQQARDLALELRSQHNLKSYLHEVTLNLTEGEVGRGVDRYGAPLRLRYRGGDKAHEWAVLVGDFPSVDDGQLQRALSTVKTLRPEALRPKDGQTTQSLAGVRAAQAMMVDRLRANKQLGPMRSAFVTRNPLLPKEYFNPKGVDRFVAKMNKGVEHSLLEAPGKYTVKVATFRGRQTIGESTAKKKRRRDDGETLVRAAENAHILVRRLRERKWPAYVFHDRNESIVTIGAFDAVSQGVAGSDTPTPEVQQVLQTFGAGYNTPADPLLDFRPPMEVRAQASQRLQQFNRVFNGQHGQVAAGYNPKFVRHPPKDPNGRIIPFDVHPHVVEIPKASISSSFAWRR